MFKKSLVVPFVSLLLVLLAACAGTNPDTPNPQVPPSATANEAGTVPGETPTAPPETSEPGKGQVVGVLIRRGQEGEADRPYQGLRVFLGTLLPDDQGNLTVGRVDPMHAPRTQTDAQGQFVFTNVEPGRYILAIQLPPNNIIMLRDPDSAHDLLIDVQADEVVDVGELRYDFPFGNP